MAWHNSGAMQGNGAGAAGGGDAANGGSAQGTEYTLQGVMRFLQSEWHRHERDRNAWDIERAEMKSRIGKLEGDGRTAKRMQETLGKHVKILENALRRERNKAQKPETAEQVLHTEADSDVVKENAKIEAAATRPRPKKLAKKHDDEEEMEEQEKEHDEVRQQNERDKSKFYLGKCVQEITYHVIPSTIAQQALAEEQEQLLQNHQYVEQQSLEDIYLQQQQRPKPVSNHANSTEASAMQNHQLSASRGEVPMARSQPIERGAPMTRDPGATQMLQQGGPVTSIDTRNPARQNYGFPTIPLPQDRVEKISHSYDSFGNPIQPGEEDDNNITITEQPASNDPNGWNFDDENEPIVEELPPPDYIPPRRPDTTAFPSAHNIPLKSPPRGPGSHKRKSSLSQRRQSDGAHELRELSLSQGGSIRGESSQFKVRFALRGHLDVVRSVIFTGGGTPAEPEICTTGDDGVIKRWIIPASYGTFGQQNASSANDLDVTSYFTHRGHSGSVMSLTAAPASPHFLTGGRALGDGWVFSGGQDATVRVWERGRVDPKATLEGHTDAVWTVCVLPGSASTLGDSCSRHGGPDRMLLASGSADGTILVWAISSPPQLTSPSSGSRRGPGGRRANSISSGSNFPSSPQPSTATSIPFHHSLVHRIERVGHPSPTSITPFSLSGENFVVSYADASVLIYDTRTGEEIVGMASQETYDQTPATSVNAVVATTAGLESSDSNRSGGSDEDGNIVGPTGSSSGLEGMVLSGHEDRFIRFFDANSGQCTYTMLAHPSAISAVSLSPDARELVSAGHDASLRFWSLETRSCTQVITSHRLMRGEGVCAVVWSADGRWVVSGGGDGTVKVWGR